MNTAESQLGVWSEAGRLRRVMVCAPGLALQRLTPENCNELLFDDVIWLQQARRDHFDFVADLLRMALGADFGFAFGVGLAFRFAASFLIGFWGGFFAGRVAT